jgi:peroxiredoxin Q/BCP
MALQVGERAPDFALQSDEGVEVRLRDFAGKRVVLYFYPKDQTPGCTAEACDFRDALGALRRRNVAVLGVSKDSVASHQRFKAKHGLNFPLLSDPDAAVLQAYGAWGEKAMYGKRVTGTLRSTFLVGADGTIERLWSKVKVQGHADEVLAALER